MIATGILAIVASAFIAALIQNQRMAMAVAYRTVATTMAFGIAEQMRSENYARVGEMYKDPASTMFEIEVLDPTFPTAVKGVRKLRLPINSKDGAEVNQFPTELDVPYTFSLDPAKADRNIRIPIRYWVSVQRRQPTTTQDGITYNLCELYEIALVYQWRNVNQPTADWQSGVVRIVTPNLNMNESPAI